VGGNPYNFDEYEICVSVNEAVEKKDWEKLTVLSRKPLFGFIEIELVKSFKKWILSQPVETNEIFQTDSG
jgi:hypothetical protein